MSRWPVWLAQYAIVLWVALTLNFALPRLAPGDPLEFLIGPELATLSPAQRQRVLHEVGFDRPVLEQYFGYLVSIARGDLGRSIRYGGPVRSILADRIGWTALLILPSILIGAIVGTALGVFAIARPTRGHDAALVTAMVLVDAVPVFWTGMLLIAVFTVTLGWLPSYGAVAPTSGGTLATLGGVARRLILPVATLSLAGAGHTFLIARASLRDALGEDFVRTASAKGLARRAVLGRHALRNAVLPVYTHTALGLGSLLSGAVVVETVFSYPGVGRLIAEAVATRDYPLLQGAFLSVVVGIVAANLLTELTYPLLDPRLRSRRG